MARKRFVPRQLQATIESMTHEGKGVVRVDGKVIFVSGGLPGEEVVLETTRKKRRHEYGKVLEVLSPSPDRVEPACEHFGVCGGCSIQHLAPEKQIEIKQKVLIDDLTHLGKVEAEEVLPPLTGTHWGYRRKARMGVKDVAKKGRVLVGFREKGAPYIAMLESCKVLHPAFGERLMAFSALIGSLQARARIAQIEVAAGDDTFAAVFRNLDPLSEDDCAKLAEFEAQSGITVYLQPGGLDTVTPLSGTPAELIYTLPEFDLRMAFEPFDFTQVNLDINRSMMARAIELLQLKDDEKVLDLFCGLGNFTLPIARHCREVVGVEGDAGLIERAKANAERNGLDNVRFYVADLAADLAGQDWLQESYDKVLLDPARAGAMEMVPHLAGLGVKRIVYVSCNPATLARDAGLLVHEHGYRLEKAGVMDMFPHTAHVESIALFTRD